MSAHHRFAGHVALVTGASGGMGAEVSKRLGAAGAKVAALDVDRGGAERTAQEIRDAGGMAQALECDISSPKAVKAALHEAETALGLPDLVVNCAGVIRISDFLSIRESDWDKTLAVNLKGTFLVIQTVGQRLVESGTAGRIVAIASIAARGPRPDCADYAASKTGVISVVQSAAVALAPYGITVNAICPGVVDTVMTKRINEGRGQLANIAPEESLARAIAKIPLGRIETPGDVANAVLFFLSDEGSYVTGQALNVCGGLHFN